MIVESVTLTTASRALLSYSPEPVLCAVLRAEEDGASLHVSRYPDEAHWVADAIFTGSGFPHFSNGLGARCTGLRTLDSETAAMVDAAVAAAGL